MIPVQPNRIIRAGWNVTVISSPPAGWIPIDAQQVHQVLVFRALQIGDLLCAVPALQALRRALPVAHIALIGLPWATQFAQRYAGLIDEFIAFPGHPQLPERPSDRQGWPSLRRRLRARCADLAIQLQGSGELSNPIVRELGARVTVGYTRHTEVDGAGFFPYPDHGHESARLLALMAALGFETSGCQLSFPLLPADEAAWQATALAMPVQDKGYVCVHPGARDPARRWPVEAFARVADHLAAAFGVQVVLTGSTDEQALVRHVAKTMRHGSIQAALPWSIGAMAACMKGARLLVCNDSGVSHLAAGLGLPSVVVFRRDARERWAPPDRRLHRCVLDADGDRSDRVIAAARDLMHRPSAMGSGVDRYTS